MRILSQKDAKVVVRNKLPAVGLIESASHPRYVSLIKTIREQFALGSEKYPDMLEKAFTLLNLYERLNPIKKNQKKKPTEQSGGL